MFLRNKIFQTLIYVFVYASKETPFKQYPALENVYIFAFAIPLYLPLEAKDRKQWSTSRAQSSNCGLPFGLLSQGNRDKFLH